MPFVPTYENLDERAPWKNIYYNTLVTDLQTAYAAISGASLEAPLVLDRSGQNLDGGDHNIHSFKRWFGAGTDVSVRDVCGFGATGDGSTDDFVAIMKAIDDLPTTGGCILFPPGNYRTSDPIKLSGTDGTRSNVMLWGFGRSSILSLTNNADCDLIEFGKGSSGHRLLNLYLDGRSSSQTSSSISRIVNAISSTDCRVDGCVVTSARGYGIDVGQSTRFSIEGTWITACTEHGVYHSSGTPAVGLIIGGCNIYSNTKDGLFLAPISETMISDCSISSNTDHGIRIECAGGGNSSKITITGNVMVSNGNTTNDRGIYIYNNSNGNTISLITIAGNFIDQTSGSGVLIEGTPYAGIRAVTLHSNVITESGDHGISLKNNVRHCAITGNTCFNNGNTVSNSAGIDLEGDDDGGEVEYNAIVGNQCFDNQGGSATQDYGILVEIHANRNEIVGNPIFGNSTAPISDSGTDNDIAHNIGYPAVP